MLLAPWPDVIGDHNYLEVVDHVTGEAIARRKVRDSAYAYETRPLVDLKR